MSYTGKEIFEAFGGNWALLGFLFVVVAVAIVYTVKAPKTRRSRTITRDEDAPDLDEGIDL